MSYSFDGYAAIKRAYARCWDLLLAAGLKPEHTDASSPPAGVARKMRDKLIGQPRQEDLDGRASDE